MSTGASAEQRGRAKRRRKHFRRLQTRQVTSAARVQIGLCVKFYALDRVGLGGLPVWDAVSAATALLLTARRGGPRLSSWFARLGNASLGIVLLMDFFINGGRACSGSSR